MGASICSGCRAADFDVINCNNITSFMFNLKTQVYEPTYENDFQRCNISRRVIIKHSLNSFLERHGITKNTQPVATPDTIKDTLLSIVFPKANFLPYMKEKYDLEPNLEYNIFKYNKENSYYAGFCLLTTYSAEPEEHKLEVIAEKSKCNDYPEGYGSYLLCQSNGFIKLFDGIFRSGEFKEGIIIDSDYIYVGEHEGEAFKGYGKLYSFDQTIFMGIFEHGLLNGSNCTMFVPNNYYYEGDCFSGSMHGKGKLTYINPSLNSVDYEGDLIYGAPDGDGKMRYKNGSTYIGQWKEGKHHGKGRQVLGSEEYEGYFIEGKKHGKGQLKKPCTNNANLIEVTEGEWKDDVMISKGNMVKYNEKGQAVQ